jgi:hypothetical protein
MQAHVHARVLFEELDEWQIGVLEGLFEHVAEIAAGLVCVNHQDEMKAFWHGDSFSLKHHTVRGKISDSRDDKNAPKPHFGSIAGAGLGGATSSGRLTLLRACERLAKE